MDLAAIRARCETRYQDPNNHVFAEAEWNSYINDAYDDVLTAFDTWPWIPTRNTLVIPAGQNTVDLPADVWRVLSMFNGTDNLTLYKVDGRTSALYQFNDLDSTGTPQFYRIFGNAIEVFPAASQNTDLVVEYAAHPGSLALDTDEPVFPRPYHKILVDGALAYAHEDDDHMDQAQRHQQRFVDSLTRLVQDLLAPQNDGYPIVSTEY